MAILHGGLTDVEPQVDYPQVLLQGTPSNRCGPTLASLWLAIGFPDPADHGFTLEARLPGPMELFESVGITPPLSNPGPVGDTAARTALIPAAVAKARHQGAAHVDIAEAATRARVTDWTARDHVRGGRGQRRSRSCPCIRPRVEPAHLSEVLDVHPTGRASVETLDGVCRVLSPRSRRLRQDR
ncbi:MAG: hypothetical protein U0Q21_11430 [Dermatophilaceae bacterium]